MYVYCVSIVRRPLDFLKLFVHDSGTYTDRHLADKRWGGGRGVEELGKGELLDVSPTFPPSTFPLQHIHHSSTRIQEANEATLYLTYEVKY